MPGELEPSAAMSGAVDEDGRSTFAQDGSVAGEDTNEPTGNERGHPVGDGREGDGEEESESESESAPLLRRGVVTLVPAVPARVGSIQGDRCSTVQCSGRPLARKHTSLVCKELIFLYLRSFWSCLLSIRS